MRHLIFPALAIFGWSLSAHATITIDGVLDENDWQNAQVFDQFKVTEPFSQATPEYSTTVKVLSTPDGLLLGVRAQQPYAERTRTRKARDSRPMNSDIFYAMIDFNGDGESAYEFTINVAGTQRDGTVVDENKLSADWDGQWQSAVHEDDDFWSAEILLPWTIAPMRDADLPERTIAVNFGRYNWSHGQRYAFPAISFNQPRFLSDFQKIRITQFQQSLINVIPYAAASHDFANGKNDHNVGVDVFWKPNGDNQLALTLNPDFGQVESDELVVNFSAIETFYSDKRPFFTENQSVFDLRTPEDGLLINTRRIGASTDDGLNGSSDIDIALKANGTTSGIGYGVFAAREADAGTLGRSFYATRFRLPLNNASVGHLFTYVDHPYNSRTAKVNTIDYNDRLNDDWLLEGQISRSDIDAGDNGTPDTYDYASWLRASQRVDTQMSYFLEASYFGRDYDSNDFGYMQRNNFSQLHFNGSWNSAELPDDDNRQGITWTYRLKLRENNDHEQLPLTSIVYREVRFKDTSSYFVEWWQDTAGIDDLLTQGHGNVQLAPRTSLYLDYFARQAGNFHWESALWWHEEGVQDSALQLELRPSWIISDAFTVGAEYKLMHSRDWLIWRDNIAGLGRYQRQQSYLAANAFWTPAARHEFRMKWQWLGVQAQARESMVADSDGKLSHSNTPINDFTFNSSGLQLRYRYEIAPLSEFYFVYSRGGIREQDETSHGLQDLFDSGVKLRDSDQILLKLRYLFS